jgi:PIN domain nuclease of toxin-antitoxin system
VIVLDTNALAWVTADDRRLGRKARALIEQHWSAGEIAVPAIAFWEIGMLQARRRLQLPSPLQQWRKSLLDAGIIELPLDGETALRSLDLSGLPDDPADRFIVATAILQGAALMTADEKILDWRHALERHDARA